MANVSIYLNREIRDEGEPFEESVHSYSRTQLKAFCEQTG